MNSNTFLVITSIASPNIILQICARECKKRDIKFIVIGDTKSPKDFSLANCDFWSIERQKQIDFKLAKVIPEKHYARKNIGYLLAIRDGAEIIIETDDDNVPMKNFWGERELHNKAHLLVNRGWVNVYKYFVNENIWPRGFALDHLHDIIPNLNYVERQNTFCPIQQGLVDVNPDVDAICRFIMPLGMKFDAANNIALSENSWCPFNSQNTTWFRVAFPLLYLPSYCSFRMTDIWRSFVAQRIAWTCDWNILFHKATVSHERNVHNLLKDFEDEIPGYLNNEMICRELGELDLKEGADNIIDNLTLCYKRLVEKEYLQAKELELLESWINDLISLGIC